MLHPSGRWRSIHVRHAFRTAFGLLVMLVVTSGLEPGDPLVSTVLLTTFAILQASWRDTLAKARNKVIGVVAGSAAVGVILVTVPERYLVAIAAVALILGLWYITSRPALGAGFMVVVSVGFNAVTRDLDPGDLLVQYVALTACAVAVGLVLGFAVVPSFRPAPLRERVESATEATTAVLRAAASATRPSVPELLALHRDAVQKQDELVPDHEHLDDRQLAELERLRSGLRDLTTWLDTARPDRAALARAVDLLHEDATTPRSGDEPSTDAATARRCGSSRSSPAPPSATSSPPCPRPAERGSAVGQPVWVSRPGAPSARPAPTRARPRRPRRRRGPRPGRPGPGRSAWRWRR